ncbi:hypothetical protein H1D32_24330, partial [Anaerobacillus sp. CMMVII]|uniref:hypothetical protein n=1 Tax=Anaerobacillus sp. CMMVII TaxID=2755588 RepID=UPI0021B75DD6
MRIGKAEKGSQYLLQKYVSGKQELLNQLLVSSSPTLLSFLDEHTDIEWCSPIAENGYYEYRDDFLTPYFQNEPEQQAALIKIRNYWPKNGPQWDGIAVITNGNISKGLILVESKANISETYSKMKASSEVSRDLIEKTLTDTQKLFGSQSSLEAWTEEFYQLGNRLALLHLLNNELKIPTWLALVNFTDDTSH